LSPDKIKQLRKQLGLTQTQFAGKIGVHLQTISRWERGETAPLGLAQKALERLAKRAAKKEG
jgi:putative transcriptional regulator